MKKLIATAFMAAASLSTVALAADEDRAEWLFVQSADGAEVVDGTTLAIPLEREIFAFTERPYRRHHYLNAHEFAALWSEGKDSFEADPPNAVMTWVVDGEVHEAEFELVDVATANHGRVIVYEVDSEAGTSVPEEARHVSLFVDGFSEVFNAMAIAAGYSSVR
ncbi:hypothetical protein [Spiribacter onubensis]|uniref:Uncharacterized protein n=1 Tax=Spiribacter onubensis TaxID=3122420 RepID=A0ABV3S6Z9_9GAMM